jgi:very-short-patch-repair endonuclease
MGLTKSEYILKQLNKSKNKIYEAYVTHRIFNAIKSYDLRFSCQQYVKFENNNYALLDMYFPDLNVQVEIDEGHHNNKENIKLDEERQEFIIGILNLKKGDLKELRVKIYDEKKLKCIEEIDKDIDEVIVKIKNILQNLNPEPWNYDEDFSYKKYLNKKEIKVSDNIQLKYISDVINLFGGKKDGNHFKKASQVKGFNELSHIKSQGIYYWCPQKNHKNWDNRLSDDGLRIYEKDLKHGKEKIKRATFFKAKDNLGNEFYRFVGVYGFLKVDRGYNVYEKISDSIEVLPVKDN